MSDGPAISPEEAGIVIENPQISFNKLATPENRNEHGVYNLPAELLRHNGLDFSQAAADGSPLQDFITALLKGRNRPLDPNQTVFAGELLREQIGGNVDDKWKSIDFRLDLENKWDTIGSLEVGAGLRHYPIPEQEEKAYKDGVYKKLMDQVEGKMGDQVRITRFLDRDDNSTDWFFLRWKKDTNYDSISVDIRVNRSGIMVSSLIGNPGNYSGSDYDGASENWQGANIATKRVFDVVNAIAPVMTQPPR